jgi:cob(I)alamin adenosyltransferase
VDKGMVQIYTGEGKGKTTAALGLALRASGHGLKSFIAQFAKGMDYGELRALAAFPDTITVRQYGRRCFIRERPSREDIDLARRGWEEVQAVLAAGEHDILILDELGIAMHYEMIRLSEVEALIRARPPTCELVITGRKVPPELFALADLVTEMREIKHYYTAGVEARRGIEY